MDRLTVAEAAERLGVTHDAVRKRICRNQTTWDKDDSGRVHVYLKETETRGDGSGTEEGQSKDQSETAVQDPRDMLIEFLQAELADWKQEAYRKDRIIAALTERIPAIEAPQETRNGPETVAESAGNGVVPDEEERPKPWWKRIFAL